MSKQKHWLDSRVSRLPFGSSSVSEHFDLAAAAGVVRDLDLDWTGLEPSVAAFEAQTVDATSGDALVLPCHYMTVSTWMWDETD